MIPGAFGSGITKIPLSVIVGHLRGKFAHQPMQCIDIDRQRGEIEIHARESNTDRQQHPQRLSS